MVRFGPDERREATHRPGTHSAWQVFVWEVQRVLPGTFTGEHESGPWWSGPGYFVEEYDTARIVFGPGDDGVRVVAKTEAVAQAFRTVAAEWDIWVWPLVEAFAPRTPVYPPEEDQS